MWLNYIHLSNIKCELWTWADFYTCAVWESLAQPQLSRSFWTVLFFTSGILKDHTAAVGNKDSQPRWASELLGKFLNFQIIWSLCQNF